LSFGDEPRIHESGNFPQGSTFFQKRQFTVSMKKHFSASGGNVCFSVLCFMLLCAISSAQAVKDG